VFAFARTLDDELAYFEFGEPLDPEMPIEAHLRWILADFEARKDEFNRLSRSHAAALLVQWLSEGPSGDALRTLIRAIGFLRFTSTAPAIEPYLAHATTEVQVEAILALGRIGALASQPKIHPFLESPDRLLRRAAIVALSRSLNSADLDRLDVAAGADPELRHIVRQGRQRLAAARLRDLRTFTEVVLETEEFEDLIPLVEFTWQFIVDIAQNRQRDPLVRLRALSVIRTVHMRRADRALAAILTGDAELPEIRLQAAIAAGPCKATSTVDSLVAMVSSEPRPVKEIAIRSLGQIGEARALDTLLTSWQSSAESREIIRVAIRRLCKVPSTSVIDTLRALEPWQPRAVYFITSDLRLIEEYRAGLLDGEVQSANVMARRDAIVLIAYLGGPSERPKIEALTKDADPSIRDLARAALAISARPPA
jgi:HEAT repeat protein